MHRARVLVTGANGLLGQHLIKALLENSYMIFATGRGDSRIPVPDGTNYSYWPLRLDDEAGWENLFSVATPDFVIHAGAMTQIDECELKRDECFEINVQGTARILALSEEYAKHFVFISTDFVFDGVSGNYAEEDLVNPINWYGSTKVEAEVHVKSSSIPWSILRTCLVYGDTLSGTRSNIISWVRSSLKKGEKIKVVSDQIRTPTYIKDLVRGILLLIEKKAAGIFHVSGKDTLSPFEMAMKTAEYCGLNIHLIDRVDASIFSQPGKRPLKTGFNISKAGNILGFDPLSFDEGIRSMLPGK